MRFHEASHEPQPLGPYRKSPTPQSAGEGPAAPRGLFRGRDLVVWVAPLSRPCYTQTRTPWKVLPAGIPEDSRVLVTPCSSCYLGAGSLHTGSPHVEQGRGVSRLRTTVRVGRPRQAPRVLQAVCNLCPSKQVFIWETPAQRGHQGHVEPPANTQPTAGPASTSQQGPIFSFAWSSPNFQASLRSEAAERI